MLRHHCFMKFVCIAAIAVCMVFFFGCSKQDNAPENLLDPEDPVTITIWNYYNGDQLAAFEALVESFNDSIGLEQGIIVNTISQSNINNLADELIRSAEKKAGAQDMPNLAAVYSETAYILQKLDVLTPLDEYFQDDLGSYIPSFIEAGRLTQDGALYLFPACKSTEVFACNATDWQTFESACGISISSITCIEDMVSAAQIYYNWTDALTPEIPKDGKALYGRDSVSNYIYIGAAQLGHPLFTVEQDGKLTVDLDRTTFKTLWDNYYIPFINGYFGAYAKYRSDDAKTGNILAMTCSTSAISYFPTEVTLYDDTTHAIDAYISKPLGYKNQVEPLYVQQGADYCVLKATPAEELASVLFMKWFTDTQQNVKFSILAGYSPVKVEANDEAILSEAASVTESNEKETNILKSLLTSADTFKNYTTYSSKPFAGSKDVRAYLEAALSDIALQDRQTVTDRIAAGSTREEAVSEFITEDYFDNWYQALCKEVELIVEQ